jgi:hypothetical protein
MPALPAGRNACDFGARHLVSQPHPGLRHSEPKGLVSVALRSARHRYTLINQMIVNSNLHCTIPFLHTCRRYEQWSAAEVRSSNGGMRAYYTQRLATRLLRPRTTGSARGKMPSRPKNRDWHVRLRTSYFWTGKSLSTYDHASRSRGASLAPIFGGGAANGCLTRPALHMPRAESAGATDAFS